ncbi:MAG: cardiolipin synthase [Lachnospiraceae bacterium]|nr:cardiolipin synthase [Lachnospiraceae bacterium]
MMRYLLVLNFIFSIVIVFFQRRDPKAVWTWLLVLYFIPIFGFLMYLLICQDFQRRKMFRVREVEDALWGAIAGQEDALRKERAVMDPAIQKKYDDLAFYNLETSQAVLTVENTVDVFTEGEKLFGDLLDEMGRATDHIHIQYYIIKHDELFQAMMPVLERKAAQGVEVRILYDGMGSRFVPERVWRRLRRAGVKTGEFFPALFGRLHLRINYRNHRKIVVVDGRIGYVGGFNIGKEYLGRDKWFGHWRDTHLKLTGQSAVSLQMRFALDWHYATKENLFLSQEYFGGRGVFPSRSLGEAKKPLGVQIISSGPDTVARQIRNNYLELFYKASDHIYVQTPYFVPDDAVLTALKQAAMSGVRVMLMIPCKPDHPFVYWASYSYLGDLLRAGARCFTYEGGFLHAKGVCVDGEVACYGTANMDIRSFELNFEVNAVVYDCGTVQELERIFIEDLKECKEVTPEIYANRSLYVRIREQTSRLLSPLL